MKQAYDEWNIISDISTAICLLLECKQYCTPTDVLRTFGMKENNITRKLVIEIAELQGYAIKSSSRGYRISLDEK